MAKIVSLTLIRKSSYFFVWDILPNYLWFYYVLLTKNGFDERIVRMFIIRKIYYLLFDLIQTLVIAGAIFVVVYAFLFRPYQVNGLSMYPNFEDGEYVLTNLIEKRFSPYERGEVIVFHSPTEENKDFIKRIIGIEGDLISISRGDIYLNGKLLEEEYLPSNYFTTDGNFLPEGTQVKIPTGQFFVMGDNRSNSSDSREWGFVSKDEIIGKSFFVYWPLTRFRVVEHAH